MNVQSISLPTGAYDWSEQVLPRALFDRRLSAVRDDLRRHGLDGLILHGNQFDHGALSWLTAFTPKLGPALGFVGTDLPPRLSFTGGPGMQLSARRLTFLPQVSALKSIEHDVKDWLRDLGTTRVALCEGNAMSRDAYLAVERALGGAPISLDEDLDILRRRKDDVERSLIRQAHRALTLARRALLDQASQGRSAAALAAEAAARSGGAQDVRVLIASQAAGAPRPFDATEGAVPLPAPYGIAVRLRGYWACAEGVLGAPPELEEAAQRLLSDACRHRGLLTVSDGWRLAWHGLGLSLQEMPTEREALRPGDVVTLRVTRTREAERHLAWSMMAQVENGGIQPVASEWETA